MARSPSATGGPVRGRSGQGAWHRRRVQAGGGSGLHPCPRSLPTQPMNATSAFGPNLRYIVKWRRRETRETWNNVTVWGSRYVVGSTPVYVPYEIRVQAENDFGKGPEPDTVIGYSGEDCEYPPLSPSKDPHSRAAQSQPHKPGTSGWVMGLPRTSWEDSRFPGKRNPLW